MPSKHHRPAALQRRSTSGSNTKLTLSGLNPQKLDASPNLQLQAALNNATKDLPRGKGKKSSGQSNQPPSRTTSDQQFRSSHLREQTHTQTQRTATGATRPTSQRPDPAATTKSDKKPGFTLASPVVVAQEIEGEGDSDEWISSESLSVTPQNQSSDSESGDGDDDVEPTNPNLTGAAHRESSPDDREPPTPTVPRVKMQPPTPVNNVDEHSRHRSSTTAVQNEVAGANAAGDGVDRPHARPEDGLASTPRPRAIVDRDTETSRNLLPTPLPHPLAGPDSTAREPSTANTRLRGDVDRPRRPIHSAPPSHPHTARDSPAKIDNNPQGRDQIAMTQQQHQQQQVRPPTPTPLKPFPLSSPPSPTHYRDKAGVGFPQAEQQDTAKRSRTRPPSLHSPLPGKSDYTAKMTRPHPLIRGSSLTTNPPLDPNAVNIGSSNGSAHQNGVSTVAVGSGIGKLAPLTTITAVPSVSSSPSSSSPVSVRHKGKEEDEVKERLRRQSIASVSSVNTQRSLGRAAGHEYTNQGSGFRNQRERTLSTLSSSPYAALSALYPSYSQQNTSSQYSPKSPGGPFHQLGPAHGFTSRFPAEGDNSGPTASELMHMLLPAPYLSAHMTVLKGRSPIREAVERVSRARKAQSSQ